MYSEIRYSYCEGNYQSQPLRESLNSCLVDAKICYLNKCQKIINIPTEQKAPSRMYFQQNEDEKKKLGYVHIMSQKTFASAME